MSNNNNVTMKTLVDKQGNVVVPVTHIEAVFDSQGNSLPEYLDSRYPDESKPAEEDGLDLSLVTTGEKYEWNDKYDKPSTGIPSSDLSSDVLSSLGKANAAIPNTEKGANNGVATLDSTGKVPSSLLPSMDYIPNSEKGANGGVATLDNTGKVPSSQLPSYVDDVIEGYYYGTEDPETHEIVYNFYSDASYTELITPESGKIYIDLMSGKTYRWGGSTYVEISASEVTGIKVGQSGNVINPSSGIVTIPDYEVGAQVHRAPTEAEVKSALGTGSGTTKYLREDGQWETPPDTQYSLPTASDNELGGIKIGTNLLIDSNGVVSATDTTYSDFVGSGSSHAHGLVPDPGATAGTSKYLREDGSWSTPAGRDYTAGNGIDITNDQISVDETVPRFGQDGTQESLLVPDLVNDVAFDSTNNKFTVKKNNISSDIVTLATLKQAMSLNNVENKSSATIRGELTSSDVTTALGYTPANNNSFTTHTDDTTIHVTPNDKISWNDAALKAPTYIYSSITLNVNSFTSPIEGNITNNNKQANVLFHNTGSTEVTVTVPTTYKTPKNEAITIKIPAGGYAEVNCLVQNGLIFVRAI